MKTEIKKIDGVDSLVITLPLQTPKISTSGKSLVVAGSNGATKTDVKVNDKQVTLTVTAYIKND